MAVQCRSRAVAGVRGSEGQQEVANKYHSGPNADREGVQRTQGRSDPNDGDRGHTWFTKANMEFRTKRVEWPQTREQEESKRVDAYTTQSYVNQGLPSQFGLRNLDDSEGV